MDNIDKIILQSSIESDKLENSDSSDYRKFMNQNNKLHELLSSSNINRKKQTTAIFIIKYLNLLLVSIVLIGFIMYIVLICLNNKEAANSFLNIYEKTLMGIFPLIGTSFAWLFKEDSKQSV